MCRESHMKLQDKQSKHGLWEMKWERQPHDILVSDLFMSHWKMLRDHDQGCGIMNQSGVEVVPPKWSHENKSLWCCPAPCVNVAGCAGESIPRMCRVTQALVSVLGPQEVQRLLDKCRWPVWTLHFLRKSFLAFAWSALTHLHLTHCCQTRAVSSYLHCLPYGRRTIQWNLYSIFVDSNCAILAQKALCAEGNCCCLCRSLTVESIPFPASI